MARPGQDRRRAPRATDTRPFACNRTAPGPRRVAQTAPVPAGDRKGLPA